MNIKVRQKHMMVFEIWKPACQLRAAFVLTVITYSAVWNLVEMEHWSVQHRIARVELFIKTRSVTATHHGFCQQFQRCDAPSRNTLLLWVSKWHQEGSVSDSKPQGRLFLATTLVNFEWVRGALMCKSTRRQALALRLNKCSVCWILHKDLYFHPYKLKLLRR